ncbi:uncharacterized protein MELLADRAFT_63625 [Melampsora larici-populina 98AG31]|uniref:Uncharacterized protein n=1 Tax=Melampsora larici-populina (strain 98AG31 / pathotype 3-4-7) TaxID=747676 RepID=F4RNC8_MELLP|nr:uncharacterized protein MELLADRAFT_63625 [Melampsora larici-populina 98AG31]EGG06120.1 hypothetical protein MELLADRAFT_63625 [Melampsora larici-populina 98AG31]
MSSRECPVEAYTNLMNIIMPLINTVFEPNPKIIPTIKIDETIRTKLFKSILNFPEPGIAALSDELINKPYSLMSLLIKTNDKLLFYAMILRGISVRRSKISKIELSSSPIGDLIKKALRSERNNQRLEIPHDILAQLNSFRSEPIVRVPPRLATSKRRALIEIEDNKPEIEKPVSKRARLAQIQDQKEESKKIELAETSKPIKPEPFPKPTIPNHDPPFIMKLMKIPNEANEISIKHS